MTGKEYQYIRKFNKVSQIDVAKKLGLKSNYAISMIEKEELVAERLIQALSDLTGISVKNLLDDQWVAGYCEKIPENYKKPKFFRSKSIWLWYFKRISFSYKKKILYICIKFYL